MFPLILKGLFFYLYCLGSGFLSSNSLGRKVLETVAVSSKDASFIGSRKLAKVAHAVLAQECRAQARRQDSKQVFGSVVGEEALAARRRASDHSFSTDSVVVEQLYAYAKELLFILPGWEASGAKSKQEPATFIRCNEASQKHSN